MKYIARKAFKDLENNVTYQPGDEFEVTVKRAKEMKEKLSKYCSNCNWFERVEEKDKEA